MMFVIGLTMRSDAQVGPSRKILFQRDLDIPGYEMILNEASIAVEAPDLLVGQRLP